MSVLESLNETSNKAVDSGQQLYEKTVEYYKLKLFQQLAMTTGVLGKLFLIGSILLLALIFFMVAGVIYIGAILNSISLACVMVGSLLILIALILYKMRKKIDNAVVKKLSLKFFD